MLRTSIDWLSCSTCLGFAKYFSKSLSWLGNCYKIIKWGKFKFCLWRAKVDKIRVMHNCIACIYFLPWSSNKTASLAIRRYTSQTNRILETFIIPSNIVNRAHIFVLCNRLTVFWAVSVVDKLNCGQIFIFWNKWMLLSRFRNVFSWSAAGPCILLWTWQLSHKIWHTFWNLLLVLIWLQRLTNSPSRSITLIFN